MQRRASTASSAAGSGRRRTSSARRNRQRRTPLPPRSQPMPRPTLRMRAHRRRRKRAHHLPPTVGCRSRGRAPLPPPPGVPGRRLGSARRRSGARPGHHEHHPCRRSGQEDRRRPQDRDPQGDPAGYPDGGGADPEARSFLRPAAFQSQLRRAPEDRELRPADREERAEGTVLTPNPKAASGGAKVLRVGVIRDGKIIEERHLRQPTSVTIGQDGTNTFVIPASDLPSSFPVFDQRAGQYTLFFTDRMNGRVQTRVGDLDFASLKSRNMASKRGSVWALPLDDSSKGKVNLGEVTLLFQFVRPRPEPKRIELPPDMRGTPWRSIDHLFFTILVASLVVHFSGAACIALSPKPPNNDLALDELPDRFAKVLLPPKPP